MKYTDTPLRLRSPTGHLVVIQVGPICAQSMCEIHQLENHAVFCVEGMLTQKVTTTVHMTLGEFVDSLGNYKHKKVFNDVYTSALATLGCDKGQSEFEFKFEF